MKRLLILFLFLGAVFAGAFPQQISGTELQLVQSTGDTTNGEAYYATSDESTIAWVGAYPMTSSEWSEYSSYYTQYGWSKKTVSGIDYYYLCEQYSYDYYTTENLCYVDAYNNGVYYMIDVSTLGGSTSQSLDVAVSVGGQIAGGGLLDICPCPIGLLLVGVTLAGVSRAF